MQSLIDAQSPMMAHSKWIVKGPKQIQILAGSIGPSGKISER